MKKYILLLLMILLPLNINAKQLEKKYISNTSGSCQDTLENLFYTYDDFGILDGYLTCDEYFNSCTKYNLLDQKVWNNNLHTTKISIENFSEQNGKISTKITKYTSDNIIAWENLLTFNQDDYFETVIKNYNNQNIHDGYLVFGTTTSTNISGVVPGNILIKYNLDGTLLWIKNIKNYKNILFFENGIGTSKIVQTSPNKIEINSNNIIKDISTNDVNINYMFLSKNKNGYLDGFIILGTTSKYYYHNTLPTKFNNSYTNTELSKKSSAVIIKYDLTGTKCWENRLDNYNESGFFSGTLVKSNNQEIAGYLVVGGIKDKTSNAIIVYYDLEGNKIVDDILQTNYNNAYSDIIESYDENSTLNGYLVTSFNNTKEDTSCIRQNKLYRYRIITKENTPIETSLSKVSTKIILSISYLVLGIIILFFIAKYIITKEKNLY